MIDFKKLAGSDVADGETTVLESHTVGDDELWYADEVVGQVLNNVTGSGSQTEYELKAIVRDVDTDTTVATKRVAWTDGDGATEAADGSLGLYLYPGMELTLEDTMDRDTGASVTYLTGLRRVV